MHRPTTTTARRCRCPRRRRRRRPRRSEEGEEAAGGGGGGGPDEARSLWIGGLLHWMNEDYLYSCFTRVPETVVSFLITVLIFWYHEQMPYSNLFIWMQLVSLVIKRSKLTEESDGFGFLNFSDHSTTDHVLQSYNGQKMPNSDRDFKLDWPTHNQQPPDNQHSKVNWGTQQQEDPPQRYTDDNSDHSIFVGDLAFNVTDFMLQHLFKSRYPSVKSAKVIFDKDTGRNKGYGFVEFGDANELRQAMTEMDGAYCSTRPMRIRPVPNKKSAYTYPPTSPCVPMVHRLFVGSLSESVTSEDLKQAFAPYGELVDVKVLEGKRCGFVTYSNRYLCFSVRSFVQ
ncbi:hypothetical protein PR202_gb11962 [Eleusine coracana subsp. coracana]|uniref:RRM domain-containing protein n=1 Tax=Eleusine coracana subsp. coracana TaxID=191504 RepID=A0AAV5ENU7_ELECO|nr:hypothetical protein PR202_gb11962 [Eleusine coracana subsp. coracana]